MAETAGHKNKKGRWGKTFVDTRDWVEYNEELVVRGEFLLEFATLGPS